MTENQKFISEEKNLFIAKQIVIAVGVLGVVSAVMVAPGLAKAIPLLKKIDIARINQELKRLHKRGLIEIIKWKNGITKIKLTKEGKRKMARYQIDILEIEKPKKWDGNWRVIIFDIPIKKNCARESLRKKMKRLGFYKLQASVFVYPYPCYEVVKFLRDYFGVSSEVEYLEVEKLESQNKLIGHFFT